MGKGNRKTREDAQGADTMNLGRLEDARVIERLVGLGEDGMASGIAEDFDIYAFVEAMPTQLGN